jgi:hypothetical protein
MRKGWKTMRIKRPRAGKQKQNAVTALLSTILLLAIAIALVTLIYTAVLNSTTQKTQTTISASNLVASVSQNQVVFVNRGGDAISPRTLITVTINQHQYTFTVGEINGNRSWQPGETLSYNSTLSTLVGLQVDFSIVDPDHTQLLIHGLIQEGEQGDTPYVQTVSASQITAHTARLTLSYNFISAHAGAQVRVQYKTDSATVQYNSSAPWVTINLSAPYSGIYHLDVHDLLAGQRYVFRAQLQYTGVTVPRQGLGLTFTTPTDRIGEWNFDSTSGPVLDSVSNNNGVLMPDQRHGPRYGLGYVSNAMKMDGIDDRVNISDANSLDVVDEMTFESWIKPLNNSNGSIGTPTSLSTSQFFDSLYGCLEPDWVSLGGQYYAIVSRSSTGRGYLVTVKIADNGTIYSNATSCIVSSALISTACLTPKIIPVTGSPGVYAIVYTQSNYGYMRTVSISGAGIISPFMTNFGFSTARYCYHPDIVYVGGSTYAIVFGTSTTVTASFGYIQCVSITAGGATVALKGSAFAMTHDTIPSYLSGQQVLVQEPEILELGGGSANHYFVIVYKCRDDDGGVYVVRIDPSTGAVTRINGERKFDSKRGENPEIFWITDKFYGVVFGGEGISLPYNDDVNHLKGLLTIIRIDDSNGQIFSQGEETKHYVNGTEYTFTDKEYGTTYSAYTFRSAHVLFMSQSSGIYRYAFSYSLKSTLSGVTTTRGYVRTLTIDPEMPYSIFTSPANYTYDANTPDLPDFLQIGNGTTYGVIEHMGTTTNNGLLKTFTISSDCSIATKPLIDAREIGIPICPRTEIRRISDTYCAIVYQAVNYSCYLKTFYDPLSGTLPLYYNDSLVIEPGQNMAPNPLLASYEPFLFHMTGDYYAILYRNYTSRLCITVVTIDATGHITPAYKRSISGITCSQQVGYPVTDYTDVYLIAYRDSSGRGKLLSVKLTNVGATMLANQTLDASACTEPVIYRVGTNMYAVSYSGVSSKGELKTFRITASGATITYVDEYIYTDTTRTCAHPDIASVNQTIYAVTYSRKEGTKYSSVVFTVTINQNGTIQKFNIDNLTFNFPLSASSQATAVTNPSILRVNTRIYLISYRNNVLGSGLATVRIGETGNITEAIDSSLTASADSYDLPMAYLSGTRYAVASGTSLIARSIRVAVTPTARPIFSKAGSYQLLANATHVTAYVYDTGVHTLTCPLGLMNGWNYVVLTYKAGRYMNLSVYSNASTYNVFVADTPASHLFSIYVGTSPLYFGDYAAWYDEFSMWGSAFSQSWIMNRFANPNA